MSCTDFRPALSELADGSLTGEARARLEAHLHGCEACRSALADIRRIRQAARSMPKELPRKDLWDGISARLDAGAKVVSIDSRRRWLPHSGRTWSLLAAAAVLLIAVSTGLVLIVRGAKVPSQSARSSQPAPAAAQTASAHAGDANLVESVEMELQQADQHYEKAIAGLEQVARDGRGTLDANTAAVLQKNLGVIDQAISESRAALKAQPTSDTARTSLFEALRRKVELLQDTIALINEMRKGNQAGAAQIVGSKG